MSWQQSRQLQAPCTYFSRLLWSFFFSIFQRMCHSPNQLLTFCVRRTHNITLVACRSTVSRKSCRLSSSKASTSCWMRERSRWKESRPNNVRKVTSTRALNERLLNISVKDTFASCLRGRDTLDHSPESSLLVLVLPTLVHLPPCHCNTAQKTQAQCKH